jgi:hypothetical protein
MLSLETSIKPKGEGYACNRMWVLGQPREDIHGVGVGVGVFGDLLGGREEVEEEGIVKRERERERESSERGEVVGRKLK